jgi:hypothetical protein
VESPAELATNRWASTSASPCVDQNTRPHANPHSIPQSIVTTWDDSIWVVTLQDVGFKEVQVDGRLGLQRIKLEISHILLGSKGVLKDRRT